MYHGAMFVLIMHRLAPVLFPSHYLSDLSFLLRSSYLSSFVPLLLSSSQIDGLVSISEYPLSGVVAINRIMGAIENHWGIV